MEAGLHWLAGTTWKPLGWVLTQLENGLGAPLRELGHGGYGYERSWLGPFGVRVYASGDRADIHVVFPGEACEVVGAGLVLALALNLAVKVTRIDLAVDGAAFTPEMAYKAFKGGQRRGLARRWRWMESEEGSTLYIGSRQSKRFMRIYDRRGVTRVEVELKEEAAGIAFQRVVDGVGATLGAEAIGWVRSICDFVDRSADANVSRCPLLDWWAAFVGGAEKLRVRLGGTVRATLERTRRWLTKQVSAVLATVESLEPGFVEKLLQEGRWRMGERHRVMLAWAGAS